MSQVLLINPRRKRRSHHRRSSETHAQRSAAAKKGWRHRRSRRSNPHTYKTRRRWSTKSRRRNPWYGQSRRHASAARKGWRSRRHYRRNPKGGVQAFLSETLIPGSVGAVGALGLDVLLGLIPLPAALQTGMFKPVVKLAGAAALGMLAGTVVNRRVGEQVAMGATVVVMYDIAKSFAQQALPNLPLSGLEYYGAGVPVGMGEFVPNATPVPAALPNAPGAGIVQPVRANSQMAEFVYG